MQVRRLVFDGKCQQLGNVHGNLSNPHTAIMVTIEQSLISVRQRIQRACAQAGRSDAAVTLLAVSKSFPPMRCARPRPQIRGLWRKLCARGGKQNPCHATCPCSGTASAPFKATRALWWPSTLTGPTPSTRLKIAQRLGQQRPAGKAPLQSVHTGQRRWRRQQIRGALRTRFGAGPCSRRRARPASARPHGHP